jgi:hypothetical protein
VGVGKGGEMTQTLYAYMNKIKIKKKRIDEMVFTVFLNMVQDPKEF